MHTERRPCARPSWRRLTALTILVLALSACNRATNSPLFGTACEPTASSHAVNTTDDAIAAGASYAANSTHVVVPADRSAAFVPGDVIVKFSPSDTTFLPARVEVAGQILNRSQALGLDAVGVYRAPGLDRASTLETIAALQARPDVAYAHPNYLLFRTATPTDDFYDLQWSYPDIDLPSTWDLTVSCDQVTVAVLDTGMLMDHPDRPTHLTSGYDFVSSTSNLDGDGRDGDPQDPGPRSETDYHGSHVAGTVAAATNNDLDSDGKGEGIAGTTWRAKVIPIRVLGPDGAVSDIIDAMMWASGESVSGVPDNPDPARIINLSLGGEFACSSVPALQDAVTAVRSRGSIPIAAAGNTGNDAAGTSPASCDGVLTVGATDPSGDRPLYSNWGSVVDLMAPGGGSGTGEGIYSLSRDDLTSAHTYDYLSGTSMATAHVSGVVALMLSVRPELSVDEIGSILASTANPLTDVQCDGGDPDVTLSGSDCGAGKVNAFDAVSAANNL